MESESTKDLRARSGDTRDSTNTRGLLLLADGELVSCAEGFVVGEIDF